MTLIINQAYANALERIDQDTIVNLGEKILAQVEALKQTLAASRDYLMGQIQTPSGALVTKGEHVTDYYTSVLEGVYVSPVVLWSLDTWNTAGHSTEGLVGEIFTEEMYQQVQPQTWFWERGWGLLDHPSHRSPERPNAMVFLECRVIKPLVVHRPGHGSYNGVVMYDLQFAVIKDFEAALYEETLPYITMTVNLVGNPIVAGDIYPYCFFLDQKVVHRQPVSVNRAAARRLSSKKVDVSRVKEVVLRRLVRRETKDSTGHEYTHQWIVSGHTRKQWYPSTQTHKFIFIDPYIKGPEGAPMLPFRGTLYRARR
jgi:hypothetical protein